MNLKRGAEVSRDAKMRFAVSIGAAEHALQYWHYTDQASYAYPHANKENTRAKPKFKGNNIIFSLVSFIC